MNQFKIIFCLMLLHFSPKVALADEVNQSIRYAKKLGNSSCIESANSKTPGGNQQKLAALLNEADTQGSVNKKKALRIYLEVIKTANSAISKSPNIAEPYNFKAIALSKSGDILRGNNRFKESKQRYFDAVVAASKSIELGNESLIGYQLKSIALTNLGKLQFKGSDYRQGRISLLNAIEACDHNLAFLPSNDLYICKGNALLALGSGKANTLSSDHALTYVKAAIENYNSALTLTPDFPNALNNKAIATRKRGELEAKLSRSGEARESFLEAICIDNELLKKVPNYKYAPVNKAISNRYLVRLNKKIAEEAEKRR